MTDEYEKIIKQKLLKMLDEACMCPYCERHYLPLTFEEHLIFGGCLKVVYYDQGDLFEDKPISMTWEQYSEYYS